MSKGIPGSSHDAESPGTRWASGRLEGAAESPPAPAGSASSNAVHESIQLPARSIERDGPETAASWRDEVARSRAVPSSVGPYRDLEPLGEGGMGVVYRARHHASNTVVALKTVSVPGTLRIDGLRREIRALSRIRHPGIVRIVEHGVHEGLPWYAMDLIKGECLRQLGRRIWNTYRPLSKAPQSQSHNIARVSETAALLPEEAEPPSVHGSAAPPLGSELPPAAAGELRLVMMLMRRVCATLAYLHGEGIVNCDLKPDNLIVVDDQPVLIDFGLATRHPGAHSRESLEVRHALSGTLPYVSPEQARGEFTDARSDLYSFGCMLYELVVGEVPFCGSPNAMLSQHFSAQPVPPSQRVSGVPFELDRCILRLLEKKRSLRPGHADEVAALLADLSGDVHRLSSYPPAAGYLYGSPLVGRDAELAQLMAAREACLSGKGSLVLVGGESGVGKTRLMMELTRLAQGSSMKVITGEGAAHAAEESSRVRPAPLHLFRPLLRATADLCMEGGPTATEALLGPRRSVLAMYEPLLTEVPANEPLAPPVRLAVQASRDRLFRYLSQTLAALAKTRPTLLVLDDIMWADELSLAFLAALDETYLMDTPVLVLCTHRSEEASEAVAALAAMSHVQSLGLPRLDAEAIQSMVVEMLALQDPPRGLVEFVGQEAEGNPFFAGEYLRTAVQERVLFRSDGSWQMAGDDRASAYRALQLPGSVRLLIARRLQRTSPSAQTAATAAAVLGRETEVEVLSEVSGLSDEALMDALTELTRRQVLEIAGDDAIRFVHGKLREVGYALCSPDVRRDLHERAGNTLAARLGRRAHPARHWAAIGQHFVEAQLPEQAVRYLELAAAHARTTSALGDAIRLYREALRQIDELSLQLAASAENWDDRWRHLQEALGDVLALAGEREAAPLAFERALERTPEPAALARARLYRKCGESRELEFRHEEALALFMRSMQAAGEDPREMDPERRDEWIHAQIDRQRVFYWLNRIDEMDRLVTEVRPIVERFGTAERIVEFCHSQMQLNLRRDRYVASEQTLRLARHALAVCPKKDSCAELPMAQFMCGFAMLFNRAYSAAEVELEAGLTLSARVGDLAQQARCLTYLAVVSRMRGDVSATDERSLRLLRMAGEARMHDYLGAGQAHRAWVLVQRADADGAEREAREAVRTWRALTTYSYPFQWLAYLPLMDLLLSRGDIAGASECVSPVLAPDQQALDGSATDGLLRGLKWFAAGDSDAAAAAFRQALTQLSSSGYR